MGYCYEGRKLCCDVCGVAGGVRKRKCAYGYCKPLAVCPVCWPTTRAKHREGCDTHCRPAAQRYEAEKAAERALLDEGHFTRRSAVGDHEAGPGWTEAVKVWFRNKDGAEQVYRMELATYQAIGLMKPATPFDFATHGKVVPA